MLMAMRLHKYLAACGVASRRQCEQLMAEGRVTVDGEIVREPGAQVDPDRQSIRCQGREVKPASHVYVALNKPPGVVCTSHDPQGRPRAIDLLPAERGRVYTVGRLDTDSEGLILLTNDGDFAHALSHPRHEVHKQYELWLHAPLTETEKRAGVMDDGERLRVLAIEAMPASRAGYGYRITLGEGRNRHLRRMAAASGKKVLRLVRVAVGSLVLGRLKRGAWRDLTAAEVDRLRHLARAPEGVGRRQNPAPSHGEH